MRLWGRDDSAMQKRLKAVENELEELAGEMHELRMGVASMRGKFAVSHRANVANPESKLMQKYRKLLEETFGGEVVAIEDAEDAAEQAKLPEGK